MTGPRLPRLATLASGVLAAGLFGCLVLPVLALALAASPADLWAGLRHPLVLPALGLSLRSSAVSVAAVVLCGTPLAWHLARSQSRAARVAETLVELPIVLPPAVLGIALLLTFGRGGLLGPALSAAGWSIPFTEVAVILAQVVVSAPFFVQSATAGFRRVDEDLLLVARTLGASAPKAFLRVAVPAAAPALVGGVALSWARAIGEFGATLLFAGSMPGRTQTMPLAIYAALEQDVRVAQALALLLALAAFATLLVIRAAPRRFGRPRSAR